MSNWDWKLRWGPPKRQEAKEEKIFEAERYDGDFPPANALDFIAWLNELIAEVPEEHRNSVGIDLDSVGGYEGSHYATIKISYRRPETDDEFNARVAEYENALREKEAHERSELARLTQKFVSK